MSPRTANTVLLESQPPLGQVPEELTVMLEPASTSGKPLLPALLSKATAGVGGSSSDICVEM